MFAPETVFQVPTPRKAGKGRRKPDRGRTAEPEAIGALIGRQNQAVWQTITFRDGPEGEPMTSRFCFLRVRAGNEWRKPTRSPRARSG